MLIVIVNILFMVAIIKHFQILSTLYKQGKEHFISWISVALLKISTSLHELTENLRRNIHTEDAPSFNLTAIKNADESRLYLNLLRDKVKDPDTLNVALTGRYGSGKSSLLRTFEARHPEFNFLNISLAAFNIQKPAPPEILAEETGEHPEPTKKKKIKATKESLQVEAIEYSILQQIFYHVKHQKIPYSRFKRIKNLPSHVLFIRSLLFTIWCGTTAYLILHDNLFEKETDWSQFLTWPANLGKLLPLLFAASGAIFILYLLFRAYNNSKFHKLNLTSGELEITPESEMSILNRHMDELIYFFEATDFNVVVLEDLDRFNDPEIFTHLRELNAIINNSEQVNRKITFIYALRDDVFKTEKRTKFFDYIIPVIPVVDTKNSADKIRERLMDMNLEIDTISEGFISDISQYVQDMRLIINTLNEFNLYRIRLNSSKESYLQLLAMMFYKNMYPKEFAKLQDGKGTAYKLLNKRQEFIQNISIELQQEAESIRQHIAEIKAEHLNNVQELRAVYVHQILRKIPPPYRTLRLDRNVVEPEDLLLDVNFSKITVETNLKYDRPNYSPQPMDLSFAKLEAEINPNTTYASRAKLLENKVHNMEAMLQRTLLENQKSIDRIRRHTLKDILEMKPLAELDPDLGQNGLLTLLVSSGYITEDYHYYLSYFYPGSLSAKDIEFLFAVKEGRSLNFDHKLDKIDTLIGRMVIRDFTSSNILNNSIMNHLLSSSANPQELTAVMNVLSSDNKKSKEFIAQYLRGEETKQNFINQLGRYWINLFTWTRNEADLPPEKQLEYLEWILKYCRPEDLRRLDNHGQLSDLLNTMPDFLSWITPLLETDHIYQIISALQLSFDRLEGLRKEDPVTEYIYVHNSYAINPHMIVQLASFRLTDSAIENLEKANLSTIIESDLEDMLSYIEASIEDYVENVFLALPENSGENEQALLFLLSHPSLIDEHRIKILEKSVMKFPDISAVEETLWPLILQYSKMEPIWTNVYKIFSKTSDFPDELIAYLNLQENNEALALLELGKTVIKEEAELETFALALMIHPKISIDALPKLLDAYISYFSSADLTGVPREKVQIMLEYDRFYLNQEMYTQIQSDFSGLQKIFVEKNWKHFMEIIDDLTLEAYDYELLLGSDKLTGDQISKLAERVTADLLSQSKSLANQYAFSVWDHNLTYVGYEILSVIFKQIEDLTLKIDLLKLCFSKLSADEIISLLALLGGKWRALTEYKNPWFDNNLRNQTLLSLLKNAQILVSKAEPKKDKIPTYTKKKPK